jgi:hypothetical protein
MENTQDLKSYDRSNLLQILRMLVALTHLKRGNWSMFESRGLTTFHLQGPLMINVPRSNIHSTPYSFGFILSRNTSSKDT